MLAFERRFLVCCGTVLFLKSVPGLLARVCFRSGFRYVSDRMRQMSTRGTEGTVVCVFLFARGALDQNLWLKVGGANNFRQPCFRSAVASRVSDGVSDGVSDRVSDACFRWCFRYLKHSGSRGIINKFTPIYIFYGE